MSDFVTSFKYKLIYVFEIRDASHAGVLKIGDATIETNDSIDKLPPNCRALNQAAKDRIKQYTNTAATSFNLLHTELAVRAVPDRNGNMVLKAFRDHNVHSVLENSGIHRKKLNGSTSREWYPIDLATAKLAIDAVKNNVKNLSGTEQTAFTPIIFRPEQLDGIEQTIKQFKHSNKMLWNAKMRYGKTLSTLEVVKRMQFKRSIIITHRPVVDKGWYEDFTKIFHDDANYIYGSKNTGYSVEELLESGKNFVYFASMQDLRGSDTVGGKHNKNETVFQTVWDFVIVDEAHEGTTTALGNEVIKQVVKEGSDHDTKFLALSGTPFNILGDYEDNVYTWDYIMEQKCKAEWDKLHFGDSNPYEELPELRIYTYDLGKLITNRAYEELEDKAFNFREFFRTWVGDIKYDHSPMPATAKVGDFVHEDDIKSFLDLITKKSDTDNYPYSKEEYRDLFKHALWMIPGVREGKALKNLLEKHPVFGCGLFKIVNVAGDGDKDEEAKDALSQVRNAIDSCGDDEYTITLSCGKLTTGVTVPEWTAVFMLSGSFSTSAANYLQTIFRVQSPCNKDGKIKTSCYVFDFAPDRTLKMVAESVTISSRAGKTSESDRRVLGDFLNYCPVISIEGTEMKKYNTNRLLQQLKRAYAERAVKNGFDDNNLYNDELLKLDDIQLEEFNKLKKIVGKSKAQKKSKEVDVNNQGFTDEEYEELEKITKKPPRERTPEELKKLEEAKEKKKNRQNAISILRGISIRMPLLIYGADIDLSEDFTIDMFLNKDIIDDASWKEFMPDGVTKSLFKKFMKYYDPEIFVAAGRRIRSIAHSADELTPTERVKKITDLFSGFKNPDKETVLTPWRVVNMHLSSCLGGYDFFDEEHKEPLETKPPRFINQGKVTEETLAYKDARILEINSKTGLYPLYVTYSIYRQLLGDRSEDDLLLSELQELWDRAVENNVFVICKTPMAKRITQRTLVGYRNVKVNAHYFDDLINYMENKPDKFVERIQKKSYWKKGAGKMQFDAIVGNPPYMIMDGGAKASARPIYQLFVENGKKADPKHLSMIVPARWYAGGKGLDKFRDDMLNDKQVRKLVDYFDASECFTDADISGGVCYFLWSKDSEGDCCVQTHRHSEVSEMERPLLEDNCDIFIRFNEAITILRKIQKEQEEPFYDSISARKPFGLATTVKLEQNEGQNSVKVYAYQKDGFISREKIKSNQEWIDKTKVCISYAYGERGDFPYLVIGKPFIAEAGTCCTETYIVIGCYGSVEEAQNVISYMKTKLFRFLVLLRKNTQHATRQVYSLVPNQDFSKPWSDEELYKKYNLEENEIAFIESMIRPM